jgi:hypothetical protein
VSANYKNQGFKVVDVKFNAKNAAQFVALPIDRVMHDYPGWFLQNDNLMSRF